MEAKDFYEMKMLERDGFSPYEQVKVAHMQAKSQTSGLGIAGLATAVGAGIVAIGGWLWAGSQAKAAKEVAIAKNDGLRDLVSTLATTVAAERNERIAGDLNITTTINDSVQGSQSGQLTAQQQAELSAINTATQTVAAGLMTGQYSQNPIKVVRVSGQRECGCDSCGCNG